MYENKLSTNMTCKLFYFSLNHKLILLLIIIYTKVNTNNTFFWFLIYETSF